MKWNRIYQITKGVLFTIFRCIWTIFKKIFAWVELKAKIGDFSSIYCSFGFITAIITIFIDNNSLAFFFILKYLMCIILILVVLYTLISISKYKRQDNLKYYKNMRECFFWILFYSSIWLICLNQLGELVVNSIIVIGYICFVLILYYTYRYSLLKYTSKWGSYVVLFIFTPLIAMFLWAVISMTLSDMLKIDALMSNTMFSWIILVLSIIMMNISIMFTEYDRIREVKVAIYFVLAIFSSISYCFFICDYIAGYLIQYKYIANLITYEQLKNLIESIIKWGSLPYLIGMVFGCFTAELVDRNYHMNNGKSKSISIDV